MSDHGLAAVGDAGPFLARLARLDRGAVVRLRTGPGERTTLWAHLPWSVLVSRVVAGPGPGDATVAAADLLAELGRGGSQLPGRRDADWRWPLPPERGGEVVERIPAGEVQRLAAAAAGALRSAAAGAVAGRSVGERMVRDGLLDHVAIQIIADADADAAADGDGDGGSNPGSGSGSGDRIEVSQRLVQAVVRMGFVGRGAGDEVLVRRAGRWVGLSASYGSAWLPRGKQLEFLIAARPNG